VNEEPAEDIGALVHRTQSLALPAAALAWAQAGHRIFPCVPGGKQPLTRHGFHDASAEPRRVAAWWRRWPEANIGLATGERVDVLDIDERRTGSGFAALADARRAGLVNGWVAAVRTPHAGLHLYYPARGDATSWSVGAAHVDFRGLGGYVLVPPSQLVGDLGARRYVLGAHRHTGQPLDSARVLELLRPAARVQPAETGMGHLGVDVERIAAWLATQREGNRNHALFWAACRLAEHGVALGDAHAFLAPAAQSAGLEDAEIAGTLRSAYRTARLGLATLRGASVAIDRDDLPAR
jgi:hypothetical protein